jgi:hypothetical protein
MYNVTCEDVIKNGITYPCFHGDVINKNNMFTCKIIDDMYWDRL